MKNKQKYIDIFISSLSIDKKKFNEKLKYNDIPEWDSIAHMTLMSGLEEGFKISINTVSHTKRFTQAHRFRAPWIVFSLQIIR